MLRNSNFSRGAQTDVLLLEIAQGLANLQKDTNLSKKIKDAYALNEAEQKAFEDAQETISKSASFLAEIEKKKSELASVEDRIKAAVAVEEKNKSDAKDLDVRAGEITKLEKDLISRVAEIEKKEKSLMDWENLLVVREESIKAREAENLAFQLKLKSAAEQSRAALNSI